MICIDRLSVRCGKAFLLEDLSLTLESGKAYALIGRNGSGKTTLMRTLCSCYPYTGSVSFDGRQLRDMTRKERERAHALLPQSLPAPDLSVRSLMSFVKSGLSFIPSCLADRKISSLSGGERQLVFLAFLSAHDVSLYCLDEAQSSLDFIRQDLVEEQVRALRERGRTVIFSSHDISRAVSLADGIILLSSGRLAFFGTCGDFMRSDVSQTVLGLKAEELTDRSGNRHLLFMPAQRD